MEKVKSFNKKNKLEVAKVIAMLHDKKNKVPDYIVKSLQDRLLWIATENDNHGVKRKYDGQPYWSSSALDQYLVSRKISGLRHEHSIPRKILHEKINKSDKEFSSIKEILNHFANAVIVSKDEDTELTKIGLGMKMPANKELKSNSNIENVFSRYKKVNINICDVRSYLEKYSIESMKKLTDKNIEEIEKHPIF